MRGDDEQPGGAFTQAISRQQLYIQELYPDLRASGIDALFMCFLYECSRLGEFRYGPIVIQTRVVEDLFERSYPRRAEGEDWGGYEDSARRFFQTLAAEVARSGRRRVDELHWLLAFMRVNEGIPARVFGELGVSPEEIEKLIDRAPLASVEPQSVPSGSDRLLTSREVADKLDVHIQTVRGWIRSGKLPSRRVGGRGAIRVRESDLEAAMDPPTRGDAGGRRIGRQA